MIHPIDGHSAKVWSTKDELRFIGNIGNFAKLGLDKRYMLTKYMKNLKKRTVFDYYHSGKPTIDVHKVTAEVNFLLSRTQPAKDFFS